MEHILANHAHLEQPRIVRRERNLDFGQFFYPNETRKIFDIRQFQSVSHNQSGDEQIVRVVIAPHAILGTLTTFDERTYYALAELWEENNRAKKVFFSEREIARRLQLGWGQNTSKAITDSLNRLRGVLIQWEGSFYHKAKERFINIKNPFTILSHLKSTSTKDEAFKAQIAEFSFDEKVLENLNSNYSRPIRFDVILSFHLPLAQAIYNLLDRKLYGIKEYHRTTRGLLLEDLNLIAKSYHYKSIRLRELAKIKEQLKGKFLAFGEVIENVEIDPDKDIIRVIRSGSNTRKTKVAQPPEKLIERKTLLPVVSTTSEKTPAAEALDYFVQKFESAFPQTLPKIQVAATKTIELYGLPTTKKLIDYSFLKAQKTGYEPKYFTGIVKYFDKGLEELKVEEQNQKRRQREIEKLEKMDRDNARIDHERTYREDYHNYVDTILEELSNTYSKRFKDFAEWQEAKRKEQPTNVPTGIQETMLRFFDGSVINL